jgi:hypothetical protein
MKVYGPIIDFVKQEHPDASVEVTDFSSGAANIDIRWRDALITVQYSLSAGFGVSEVTEDSSFEGHDKVFSTHREVIAYLEEVFRRLECT